jgi:cytochrome P450
MAEGQEGKAAEKGEEEALTDKAILANVFLMLIVGHETTATALLLSLIELAINPEWQHEVQQDLDQIFGQRAHKSWTLSDAALLSSSKLGATISEVLRLYPPVNIIPKGTRKNSPQTVREGANEFLVPANTAVQLLVVSAHHNPKYWPASEGNFDTLDRFWPRRWLAEIELSGVLAVIFKEYSLELDVRDLVGQRVTEEMDREELRAVYEEAKEKAQNRVRTGMKHHLTLQLKGGQVPLRLVRRGKERYLRAYV